ESEGSALVAGAAHVRVSLPLDMNGGFMWGCDVTPLFGGGERLMAFTAFLPLGLQLAAAPRPRDAPAAEGEVLVVEDVARGSEAELVGILPGDVLRALSYMGQGPEPSWLDKALGAQAMPMKTVMKCDGRAVDEVTTALLSNRDSPDGMITLMLERPP
ncbi:unnamed protein product, partial [Polarella glacialis]